MAAKPRSPASAAEEKARSEAIFSSIGDGAIATDEYGKIVQINQTALKILGYKESEILGKWFPKIVIASTQNGEQIPLIDRLITRSFLTGRSVSGKTTYQRKDGERVQVAASVSPILLHGRPIGAIEVFRDITLEHEIDRVKSDFISLASHQLRTPLSAIKTYTHMLIDGYMGEVTDTQKKSLRTIISAANRMNELISMLLNITRIEGGNISINSKLLNLNVLAEEVVHELTLPAEEKGLELSLKVPALPCFIKADSLLVREILSNLVANSIKYTPSGGNIAVTLKSRSNGVLFSVEDSGLGIPKYAQDQIFSKFFRAKNVIKQETNGTGLGLYLVKGLVDSLGGKIWFESQENQGTTFFFSLPRNARPSKTGKKLKTNKT